MVAQKLFVLALAGSLSPTYAFEAKRLAARREVIASFAAGAVALTGPQPTNALVKGSAPPPKMEPKERKCKSIDECEALGDKIKAEAAANERTDFERTKGGDRYRDLVPGSGKAVAEGDTIEIRYRVMRLGTKARDGCRARARPSFRLATARTRTR